MTTNNGNMPASPLSGDAYQDFAGYDGTTKTSYNPECQGLTKREHFAAMAMQGILSNPAAISQLTEYVVKAKGATNEDIDQLLADELAFESVRNSDALLKSLEEKGND